MANHKSTIKRIRTNEKRRLRNRYQFKTARNAIRNLKTMTAKADAEKQLPTVIAMIDKCSKKNIVHENKAARLKSQCATYVQAL
jgi:small subunit ribosomal protein S20